MCCMVSRSLVDDIHNGPLLTVYDPDTGLSAGSGEGDQLGDVLDTCPPETKIMLNDDSWSKIHMFTWCVFCEPILHPQHRRHTGEACPCPFRIQQDDFDPPKRNIYSIKKNNMK